MRIRWKIYIHFRREQCIQNAMQSNIIIKCNPIECNAIKTIVVRLLCITFFLHTTTQSSIKLTWFSFWWHSRKHLWTILISESFLILFDFIALKICSYFHVQYIWLSKIAKCICLYCSYCLYCIQLHTQLRFKVMIELFAYIYYSPCFPIAFHLLSLF